MKKIKLSCATGGYAYGDVVSISNDGITEVVAKGLVAEGMAVEVAEELTDTSAKDKAEEIIEVANEQAGKVIDEANVEAETIKANATEEATTIVDEATAKAVKIVDEATAEAVRIVEAAKADSKSKKGNK